MDSIEVSTILPVSPKALYTAWLDSEEHSNFTGAAAEIDPRVGGKYTAWDGYIEGETLEMVAEERIVQSWRSSEFPADSANSRLEVIFEEDNGGTKLTIKHSDIPEGDGDKYRDGWDESYFIPMKNYYSK